MYMYKTLNACRMGLCQNGLTPKICPIDRSRTMNTLYYNMTVNEKLKFKSCLLHEETRRRYPFSNTTYY